MASHGAGNDARAGRLIGQDPIIDRLLQPFRNFGASASGAGLVLIACTLVALGWANSRWADGYHHLWELPITIAMGGRTLSLTLHHLISDGLMAVFFLLVGLEIKREVLVGHLSSARQAALPVAGALGGMLVPALLYTLLARGSGAEAGWGIPMATDIAFALGVLSLLAPGAPPALRVFLAALAIADDLGAILVIAIFYAGDVSTHALAAAGGLVAGLLALGWLGVRSLLPYAILGIGLWLAVLYSGIHATIAGVVLAFTIPARTRIDAGAYVERLREALATLATARRDGSNIFTDPRHYDAVDAVEAASEGVQSPLVRLEHALQGWVNFLIMPLFALANAGVSFGDGGLAAATHPAALGVLVGLVLGKPLGITLFAWLAVKLRLASLADGIGFAQLHSAAWLGGIGFTMSLFIATLAFADPALLGSAKVGILSASVLAAVVGGVLLRRGGTAAAPASTGRA